MKLRIPLKYKILIKISKLLSRFVFLIVNCQDKKYVTAYLCSNKTEITRATTLWDKEPGTMRWLDTELKSGDIFLDIGANIGIYSLAAAHRVGKKGKVYAVEPHKPSAISLMQNIKLNNFNNIDILTVPLTSELKVGKFNYKNFSSALTGSQFDSTRINSNEDNFKPEVEEIIVAFSVDMLVKMKAIPIPDLIKIDVDGIEDKILVGMKKTLTSPRKPRSVQVELNVGKQIKIEKFLTSLGYVLKDRHFTHNGNLKLQQGTHLRKIAHNAIFQPQD
jgi:FkbM family methyltransferase